MSIILFDVFVYVGREVGEEILEFLFYGLRNRDVTRLGYLFYII